MYFVFRNQFFIIPDDFMREDGSKSEFRRMKNEATKFLFVDDDIVCAIKFKRFLSESEFGNLVVTASDGVEALEILRGDAGREKLEHPYMVILDINMPRMDGFEFLETLRKDPDLKDTVVFIMTTSGDPTDMDTALIRGADGYFPKNQTDIGFLQAIATSKSLKEPEITQYTRN